MNNSDDLIDRNDFIIDYDNEDAPGSSSGMVQQSPHNPYANNVGTYFMYVMYIICM